MRRQVQKTPLDLVSRLMFQAGKTKDLVPKTTAGLTLQKQEITIP